jgi:hypothetical protein
MELMVRLQWFNVSQLWFGVQPGMPKEPAGGVILSSGKRSVSRYRGSSGALHGGKIALGAFFSIPEDKFDNILAAGVQEDQAWPHLQAAVLRR